MSNTSPEDPAETAEWEAQKTPTTSNLDLDAIRTRADRTLDLYRSYAAADGDGEFVPLSVRFHFRHDVPALIATIEQLTRELDEARKHEHVPTQQAHDADDDALLAKVTGAMIAYGSHAGAQKRPVDAAQKIIAMVRRHASPSPTGGPTTHADEERNAAGRLPGCPCALKGPVSAPLVTVIESDCPHHGAGTDWADGYTNAIGRLRDDDEYRHWWTRLPEHDPRYGYWQAMARRHLADFLEVTGRTIAVPVAAAKPAEDAAASCKHRAPADAGTPCVLCLADTYLETRRSPDLPVCRDPEHRHSGCCDRWQPIGQTGLCGPGCPVHPNGLATPTTPTIREDHA